jgi:hypothetical protein
MATKATQFDSDTFNWVMVEVLKELEPFAKKFGVAFKDHGGTLGKLTGVMKLEVTIATADGAPRDVEREAWNDPDNSYYFNEARLEKSWLDKTFKDGKHEYQIVGLTTKRRFRVAVQRITGGQKRAMACTIDMARKGFGLPSEERVWEEKRLAAAKARKSAA